MTDVNNLPADATGHDVALDAAGAGIVPALQTLIAGISQRSEVFDDVHVTLHSETAADGAHRSVFSYRAYKHRKG